MIGVISYLIGKGVFGSNPVYEKLSNGASGADLYYIKDDFESYVLKVSKKSDGTDENRMADFNKEFEFYRLNNILKLSFVPEVFYNEESDAYGFIIVMKKYNAISYSDWNISLMEKAMNLCADLNSLDVKLFSSLNLNRDIITIDDDTTKKSFELWLEVLREHEGRFDESLLLKIYNNIGVVCEVLNSDPLRVCHGDFHPDNIVTDGEKLYIIDWQNLHIGKSAGDVAFFHDRGNGFGIESDIKRLMTYYSMKLSEYTGEAVSKDDLLIEYYASSLLTTFMYWAYYLKNASYERVNIFYSSMLFNYNAILSHNNM